MRRDSSSLKAEARQSREALSQPYDPPYRVRPLPLREQHGLPAWTTGKDPFVIAIPPPNVTGSLTMGHVLGESIRDTIVRWQRMEGRETLYPGMDHAGIATQNVVEKKLRADKISRHDLGREGFLGRSLELKEQYGGLIFQQSASRHHARLVSRERFTLDEGYSNAVLHVFKSLYDEGLIYRGRQHRESVPALPDRAVGRGSDQRIHGSLAHPPSAVREAGQVHRSSTTRPETMLGDTAVGREPEG